MNFQTGIHMWHLHAKTGVEDKDRAEVENKNNTVY